MSEMLVLGDDSSAFLAVARSLGRGGHGVHAATSRPPTPASQSRYFTAWHSVPEYRGDGDAWREAMAELHRRHGYSMIVPTSDSSLVNVTRNQDVFPGAVCAVPNDKAFALFTDKLATRGLAQELGVPVPPGRSLQDDDDPQDLGEELGLPLIVKSRASYRIGDAVKKSPVKLLRTREELAAALAGGRLEMAESYLPGWCRGVSVMARDGVLLHAFQHRRLRQKHETGPSSHRVSERCDPQLLEWTRKLVAASELTGVAMFEYRFCTEDSQHYLLEVNPRFWGSLPLAIASGADYPLWLYQMLSSGPLSPREVSFAVGVNKRDLSGEHHNLALSWSEASSAADYGRLFLRLIEFAGLMVRGRVFDSWSADDPAPFLAEKREFLSSMGRFFSKRMRLPARQSSTAL